MNLHRHIVAAFDPSIKGESGAYVIDAQVNNEKRSPHAADPVSFASNCDMSFDL